MKMQTDTKGAFDSFAPYYQLLTDEVDYERWFDYLNKIRSYHTFSGFSEGGDIKNAEILDVACGTGELTGMFAAAGARVTGVDFSPEMLTVCEGNLREKKLKCRLLLSDMRDFKENRLYDFAYCACDGMNYIPAKDTQRVFENLSGMLKKGSVFTFDIIKPSNFDRGGNALEVFDYKDCLLTIRRHKKDDMLVTNLEVKTPSETKNILTRQYPLSKEQILHYSKESGLALAGWYDFMSFDEKDTQTDKIQVVLIKS